MTVKIAIVGAGGRMGQRLIAIGAQDERVELVGAIEVARFPKLGEDAGVVAGVGPIGVPFTTFFSDEKEIDAVIDFSQPAGADATINDCVVRGVPLVMATTGLSDDTKAHIAEASELIPIVFAPSMSPAVNLAMKLTKIAAAALKDMDADVEIIEKHHRFKVDAPSGTALKFGQIVAQEMGQTKSVCGREGAVGKRDHAEIGYHAVRIGDNVGEHNIIFGMLGETLELTVKASNRDCYAKGAYAAAIWLQGKKPGLYSMDDVLGLN
ncbi:MAG: 4-hydroxy-tetrahydrodipicolinate reductase [Thermoguttaceae bacterium]|nr:4-hydroxy-tetrahydrodipicolinate reductase [Thermoguttaceae bacterium]